MSWFVAILTSQNISDKMTDRNRRWHVAGGMRGSAIERMEQHVEAH
jgi:hypothetical protein